MDVVHACGSEWGTSELYDGWGPDVPDEAATELGNLVVEEFETTMGSFDMPVNWIPQLSQVLGDSSIDSDPNELARERNLARQLVWDAFVYDAAPEHILNRVREIIKRYLLEGE